MCSCSHLGLTARGTYYLTEADRARMMCEIRRWITHLGAEMSHHQVTRMVLVQAGLAQAEYHRRGERCGKSRRQV